MSAESIRRTRSRQDRFFYHQRGVEVTTRHLTVGPDRYELAELADIMQTRGAQHPGVKVGAATAVAEAAIVAPLVGVMQGPVVWLVAVVALLVPCAVGLICAVRWPAEFTLIGRYRGREITLFVTRDEREFGQVSRAVRRAIESTL
jgi:hypothetical protein